MIRPDYCREDVVNALRDAGLKRGDVVFSHASMGMFGMPACECTANGVYALWRDAMLEVLGEEGTWVLPTFSYSFCHSEDFDPLRTPGTCGVLTEEMRADPRAVRSEDANFSVAAIGAKAKLLTERASPWSFDGDCFFARFLAAGGLFVNLNVHPATTFIHYAEAQLRVPYRWHKPFSGRVLLEGGAETRTYHHFVYDLARPETAPDFTRFNEAAYRSGAAKDVRLGRGRITCVSARDTKALVDENVGRDASFLLAGGRA